MSTWMFWAKRRLSGFMCSDLWFDGNVKSWLRYKLSTACRKWKYTPLTQRLHATNYTTFIAALLPRCEGGTYKHCFKNASYVISCLFSSPNKKWFIFLQNQNMSTSAQHKSHSFNETIILSTAYFCSRCLKIQKREVRGDKCCAVGPGWLTLWIMAQLLVLKCQLCQSRQWGVSILYWGM